MSNEHESIAYHSKRLLVAPPSELRASMAKTHRIARVVRDMLQYGFVILYALLMAQLLLTLLPGSLGSVLSRMLEPATTLLTRPFTGLVPASSVQEDLNAVLSLLVALAAYAAIHFVLRQLLRHLSRSRLPSPSRAGRTVLWQSIDPESGTLQVVPVRNATHHRYRMKS